MGLPDRKAAADADVVMQLLWSIEGQDLGAIRDRAVIAFGVALAARRSELVALDVADLTWEPNGLRVRIRRSKTDQESQGATVAVPEGRRLTPLTDLRAWLEAAAITEGPVFRRCGKAGASALPGCPTMPSRVSYRRAPWPPDSIRRDMPGTRCRRAS